ncbi:hypothetical protein VE02_09778 [Pseudogymnoascus sp. 03VT05]|nr:hypothetical protein VE02_09778 [Pseudogymnoascus sp. 03VT05]
MDFSKPNDKPALLKRPSDGDISGDLRNREKHLDWSNEMGVLRDLYPDYDPTTAQNFNEIQSVMEGWSASAEKLKETEEIWEVQIIIKELLKSINKSGYNISKVLKDGKEFDMYTQLNHMVDSTTREPKNHKDAVAMWKSVAICLLTMQSGQLIVDDYSEADIWKLAARYMSEIQPGHGSERALPRLDFITTQNEERGLGGIKL